MTPAEKQNKRWAAQAQATDWPMVEECRPCSILAWTREEERRTVIAARLRGAGRTRTNLAAVLHEVGLSEEELAEAFERFNKADEWARRINTTVTGAAANAF